MAGGKVHRGDGGVVGLLMEGEKVGRGDGGVLGWEWRNMWEAGIGPPGASNAFLCCLFYELCNASTQARTSRCSRTPLVCCGTRS